MKPSKSDRLDTIEREPQVTQLMGAGPPLPDQEQQEQAAARQRIWGEKS
jgi:hypothetical protein